MMMIVILDVDALIVTAQVSRTIWEIFLRIFRILYSAFCLADVFEIEEYELSLCYDLFLPFNIH